jgi:gamma-glutamyl-gamma-aminobutyrate hydrolase PuuD
VASSASDSGAPLIGLSTYRESARTLVWDTDFALLHQVYIDAVVAAGAIAVLLPPQPAEAATAAVERLDGLVLTGGADIEPERYGQEPQPATGPRRPERDAWELALLGGALQRALPVLGVCRGLQVLNVGLGGTLEQHVPDRVGHRDHLPAPGQFGRVPVRVEPTSRLASLIGTNVTVHCYHHQAVASLAPDLRAVAHSEDATVEAAEAPGHPFLVGVQWHPEQDAKDRRLFAGLVAAARSHAAVRSPLQYATCSGASA